MDLMNTEKVSISEIRANATKVLARVKESRKSVSITKRGVVVAHIVPVQNNQAARSSAGILKGTIIFEGDLLSPLDSDDWKTVRHLPRNPNGNRSPAKKRGA